MSYRAALQQEIDAALRLSTTSGAWRDIHAGLCIAARIYDRTDGPKPSDACFCGDPECDGGGRVRSPETSTCPEHRSGKHVPWGLAPTVCSNCGAALVEREAAEEES